MSLGNLSAPLDGEDLLGGEGLLAFDLDTLNSVAAGLAAPGADALPATPDVWSRLTVFQNAFREPDHPGHFQALAQWRGLLSLFALSAALADKYTLHITASPHQEMDTPPALADALARAPSLTLLTGLQLDQSASLITLRPVAGQGARQAYPIGLVSPTTLLAPGAGADQAPAGLAPFLEHGLRDPLSPDIRGTMRNAHWRIIARFVSDLHEAAAPLRHAAGRSAEWSETADALLRQLRRFAEECDGAATAEATLEPAAAPPRRWPVETVLPQLDATFTAVMGAAVSDAQVLRGPEAAGEAPTQSHAGAEGAASGPLVFLCDPDLARTLARPPVDVTIWEEHTLADMLDPQAFLDRRAAALAQGVLLLRPSDVFTDEALRMESAAASAHPQGAERWVAPLTPAALLLMSAHDLDERLILEEGYEEARGHTLTVTLMIPVSAGVDHPLVREYAERPDAAGPGVGRLLKFDGEDEYNPPDLFAVWPDFESAHWPHHFLYFRANPHFELTPAAGLSAAMIAAHIFDAPDPAARSAALEQWASRDGAPLMQGALAGPLSHIANADEPHAPWLERLRFAEDTSEISEIQRLRALEAIAMTRPDGPDRRVLAGLVFVRRPKAPDPAPGLGFAAIDFGTTGTVAHLALDGAYRDVALAARVHRPAAPLGAGFGPESLDPAAFEGFFPVRDVATPLATVALQRPISGAAADIAAGSFGFDEMGFSHMAYFERDLARVLAATHAGSLTYGLKWGVGKRPVAKRFLRQLIVMIAAEMAASGRDPKAVRWCFSFPESFTSAERSSFRRVAVQAALDEVFGEGVVEPSLYSESMAFIEHFTDRSFDEQYEENDLTLSLDIGGGSSDVVLWSRGRLIWRNSFPIGGQAFFTEVVRRQTRFLQDVLPTEPAVAQLVNSIAEAPGDAEAAERALGLVEAVIASDAFQDRFVKRFPLMWDEGPALSLRMCATTMLGGILWYVGHVLKGLVAQEKIGARAVERLTLVLGGRGSRVFRLLHGDGAEDSELTELAAMVLHGAEAPAAHFDPAHVRLTQRVKREVALGMLRHAQSGRSPSSAHATTTQTAYDMPLLSEVAVTRQGESTTFTAGTDVRALLQGGSLRGDSSVSVAALSPFEDFLAMLGACSPAALELTEAGAAQWAADVEARVRQEIKSAPPRLADQSMHYVEPPFITGLRVMLAWLADAQASTDYLTVRMR